MSDTNRLDSVEPIKSVEELERETGGATSSTDGREDEPHSFVEALIDPLVPGDRGMRQDETTAAPSETTENSEG